MAKNGNNIKADDLITAIQDGRGYASKAAELLGVSRTSFYTYLNRFATAKQTLEDVREKRHDTVELALMTKIDKGDTTAIIFYLKTQCKSRGYVERQEITGADGGKIEYVNNWRDSTIPTPGANKSTK